MNNHPRFACKHAYKHQNESAPHRCTLYHQGHAQKVIRVAPGAGRKLCASDVAVAIMGVRQLDSHEPAYSINTRPLRDSILSGLVDCFKDVQTMRHWTLQGDVMHSLKNNASPQMYLLCCLQHGQGWCLNSLSAFCASDEEKQAFMTGLQRSGLVTDGQRAGEGIPWRFTNYGVTQVLTERALEPCGLVSSVPEGAEAKQMTTFELLLFMLGNGWSLLRRPAKVARGLSFQKGNERLLACLAARR